MIDPTIVITTKIGLVRIRDYVQKALPTVFDDSLSYYEEISKILKLIDDIITDIDNIETDIENIVNKLEEVIQAINDLDLEALAGIPDRVDALEDAVEALQEAVGKIESGDTTIIPPASNVSYYSKYGDNIAISKGWGTDANGDGVISKDELNFGLYKKQLISYSPSAESHLNWSKMKLLPTAEMVGIKARPFKDIAFKSWAGTFEDNGTDPSGAKKLIFTADATKNSYTFVIDDYADIAESVGNAFAGGKIDIKISDGVDASFKFLKNATFSDYTTGAILYGSASNIQAAAGYSQDYGERASLASTWQDIPKRTNIVIVTVSAPVYLESIIATVKPKLGLQIKNIHTPILLNYNTLLITNNTGTIQYNYNVIFGDNALGLELMDLFGTDTVNESDGSETLLDADILYY